MLMRAGALPLPPTLLVLLFLGAISSNTYTACGDEEDSERLFNFKASLESGGALRSWNDSSSPCTDDSSNWDGVLCWNNHVWGLQLESMGLAGWVNVDPLVDFTYLQTLSFTNNSLGGSFPRINKLSAMKSIYLSNNLFSDDIPDDAFVGMSYLKKVSLENNQFNGKIPSSLTALPKLKELRLDSNGFLGSIPDFQSKGLKLVNVSNNSLAGPIPAALRNMPLSYFSGNEELCDHPLDPCSAVHSAAPPVLPPVIQRSKAVPYGVQLPAVSPPKMTSRGTKIAITVLAMALASSTISLIFILCRHRRQISKLDSIMPFDGKGNNGVAPSSFPGNSKSTKKRENGKLTFVREPVEMFGLHDLLAASAELLGSGNFGASYKASIFDGRAVVVKRFKLMNNVGREEFHEHMRRLGRLTHPNLLPLVAYYYRKEEKLLVLDFVGNGSLARHLHGNHNKENPSLDWRARLKIVKGVVRGMTYLYQELPSLVLPHGHLKSSNVLLKESHDPLLMDYALVPLVNPESAQELMVAYRSPDYAQLGRTLKKTDVWSVGILILEVLTGKFPVGYLKQGNGNGEADLVAWVHSIASDSSMGNVFDEEMKGREKGGVDMQKLLEIGLGACEEDVQRRWDLNMVVERVEELKESDSDGEQ